MLNQATINNLLALRLKGMVKALEEQRTNTAMQALSFDERFGMIVDKEMQDREKRRLERSIKSARFKESACPEDISYRASRNLDRQVMSYLLTCDYIEKSLNVIMTGSTGVGKTWLACALGLQAVRNGYSVLYVRLARLLEDLEIAHGVGGLVKARAKLAKVNLLILDDWAMAPITPRGRHELLELVDDRIRCGSILITSQLPVEKWHEYLGEPTIADAILDRLVHRAHRIELRGESLRSTQRPDVVAETKE